MRILHLAWEYPPVMYGGLGRHVHALANAQARLGHEVVVITQAPPSDLPGVDSGPVQVIRAAFQAPRQGPNREGLLDWVHAMESAFIREGLQMLRSWRPDTIHAHDWMVTHAAVELREVAGVPLVSTIHATEAGRHQGWITSELSTSIHALEWWLANTSDALITCSTTMREEVRGLFGVTSGRVIPNGIDTADWQRPEAAISRILAAHGAHRPLVVYTGRLEWEKGVHTLVEALTLLRADHPGIRVLVAGRGSYSGQLEGLADSLGVRDIVRFLGWVSEEDLRALVAAADVAVAPSVYEPFGLVALEAAALGTPVIVADTGGLAEFAEGGQLAATFTPQDPAGLAHAIHADVLDPVGRQARAQRAHAALLDRYDWLDIARRTDAAYEDARASCPPPADPRSGQTCLRHLLEVPRFAAPPGCLLPAAHR